MTGSPTHSRRPRTTAVALALALVLAACSSDDNGQAIDTPRSTNAPSSTTAPPGAPDCDQGATMDSVEAVPAEDPDTSSDWTITSFDDTAIRAHWFPLDTATTEEPVPTILMGPGWSLPGDTSETGDSLFGGMSIPSLQEAGYNVLTWDPRGFGASDGIAAVNDPEKEGRDVQTLLDWVATQPEAMLDGDGDPRVGMVGASYGGGIQLTVAQIDCRIEALVPTIAWNSLETSLYKNETVKIGWAGTLLDVAAGRDLDPHIRSANESGQANGTISAEDEDWFRSRGPGPDLSLATPTLFIQGTVDTLFTPDEAIANYVSLKEQGVPTAMLWFCGGHGVCLTEAGEADRTAEATFAWLKRYLDGDESVDTGPAFSTIDQDGTEWTASDYPVEPDHLVEASGSGTLEIPDGATGALARAPEGSGSPLTGVVKSITPGPADPEDAVEVEIPIDIAEPAVALGAPELTLQYRGTTPPGDKPVRVFAQLVDAEERVVVGNQVTPIDLVLDDQTHSITVDLETIAQRVGEPLLLQIVPATATYAVGRTGGSVTLESIELTLPVATTGITQG